MADSSVADPKFRQFSRRNGWGCPWHPLQIVAWVFIVYFIVIFYGGLVPSLVSPWHIVVNAITSVMVVGMVVTLLVATSLDPADESVRLKGGNKDVPRLDRTKHKHAIENQTCALCQVTVGPKSKHCSACNKCVSGFDHHCRWLNNCVGDRNYRWFLGSLVFSMLSSLMVDIIGIALFVGYLTDKDEGRILQSYKDAVEKNETASMVLFNEEVENGVFLAIDIVTVLLALLALVLLVHLFQFHMWLIYKGLSTYDFIMLEREKMRKKEENANRERISASARSQPMKVNKITPSKQMEKQVSKTEDEDLSRYQKALEERDQMNRGETPPPQAGPIREDWHHMVGEGSPTKVRKIKKKKKKKSLSSQDMQVSAVDSGSGRLQANGCKAVNDLDELDFAGPHEMQMRQKPSTTQAGWKSSPSVDHPYRPKPTSSSSHRHPTPQVPPPINPPPHRQREERSTSVNSINSPDISIAGSVDELNTTTMFSVNSDAKLNADGSLKFSPGGQQQALPLTPIPKPKRREDVPPLDLSALRGSTDSSNSFRPYTGTSRSYDTIRHPFEQRPLPPLRSLPESVPETHQAEEGTTHHGADDVL